MKFQVLSDLHLEFMDEYPKIPIESEVLLLAGDIGKPFEIIFVDFITYCSNNFKYVFYIPGNHEYYSNCIVVNNDISVKSMEEIDVKIKEIFNLFSNVINLNNIPGYIYNEYYIIGRTLWSLIPYEYNLEIMRNVNDYKYINKNKEEKEYDICINDHPFNYEIKYRRLQLYDVNELSQQHINHIINECNKNVQIDIKNKKIIVMTHHMPSFQLIDKKYKERYNSYLNYSYASNYDYAITQNITCWIYGHTHTPNNTNINGVKMICNSIGYAFENTNINYGYIVDI